MKPFLAAVWLLLHATGAFADAPGPQSSATQEACQGRRLPTESYHVAYTRRGCRIEQDWDGVQFNASIRCAPGIRPN